MPSFPINQSVDCNGSDVSAWLKAGHRNMVETKHAIVLDSDVPPMCFKLTCLLLKKYWQFNFSDVAIIYLLFLGSRESSKKKAGFAYDVCSCFILSLTWSTCSSRLAISCSSRFWIKSLQWQRASFTSLQTHEQKQKSIPGCMSVMQSLWSYS